MAKREDSMHVRRAWLASFANALAITVPAVAVGMVAGASVQGVLIWVSPLFLTWFVGGGIRRARLVQAESSD
jgi:hypothetical protein